MNEASWAILYGAAALLGSLISAAIYLYVERPLEAMLFLAKLVGKMARGLSLCQSALGRTQTRLLEIAITKGWVCENEEDFARLQKRLVNLWLFDASRAMEKKRKRGVPIFENLPPTNQTGNNNQK